MVLKVLLQEALAKNNYNLSPCVQEKLVVYLEEMRAWNRRINLTSLTQDTEGVYLHILDSLAIASYLNGNKILDVGSGAGLPGIPLALIYPEKTFYLIDRQDKKILFLNHIKYILKLGNVHPVHGRVEDFHPDIFFDSILSRAFASLKVMLGGTQHLIAEQGQFLAMKGIYPAEELQEIPSAFTLRAVHKLVIKGLNVQRHLVCMEKLCRQEKLSPLSIKKEG